MKHLRLICPTSLSPPLSPLADILHAHICTNTYMYACLNAHMYVFNYEFILAFEIDQ